MFSAGNLIEIEDKFACLEIQTSSFKTSSTSEDKFYSSGEFGKILQTIQKNQNLCQLKEKKSISGERLLLVFQEVNSIEKAIKCLEIF